MSKSLENFFQCWGFFFTKFGPTEVKNLANSLAMSYGFYIMVLLTLVSWGRRFDLIFCFPVIYFITYQVFLEFVLYLCNNNRWWLDAHLTPRNSKKIHCVFVFI